MTRNENGRTGMVHVPALTKAQRETVQAEIDRQRIVAGLVKVAVDNTNTAEDYACMMTLARYRYGIRQHGRLYEMYNAAVIVWSCLWLAVYSLGEYLVRWSAEG